MTTEEWGKVEKKLSGYYGRVDLLVDGRKVTFVRGLVSKNQIGTMTYVDGEFKGAWCASSCEHPEHRFLRPVQSFRMSRKGREAFKKLNKKGQKVFKSSTGIDPDAKFTTFTPIWGSVSAIRRHYQKTFATIELIEDQKCLEMRG